MKLKSIGFLCFISLSTNLKLSNNIRNVALSGKGYFTQKITIVIVTLSHAVMSFFCEA